MDPNVPADTQLAACLEQVIQAQDALWKTRQVLTKIVNMAQSQPRPSNAWFQNCASPESRNAELLLVTPGTPGLTLPMGPQIVVKSDQTAPSPGTTPFLKPPVDLSQDCPAPAVADDAMVQVAQPKTIEPEPQQISVDMPDVNYTEKDLFSGEAFGSAKATEQALKAAETLGITQDDLLRCRSIFVNGDKDQSGFVNTVELRTLLDNATGEPMDDDDFKDIIRKFDANKDGTLNFDEFLHAYCFTPGKESASLKSQIDHLNNADVQTRDDRSLSKEERVKKHGARVDTIVWYLKQELAENYACLQIPLVFCLLATWFVAVLFHTKFVESQAVEAAVIWDITENANFAFSGIYPFENGRMGHKALDDVNTFADFWSWFDLGLVPIFWPEGWDVSETRANMQGECTTPRDSLLASGWPVSSLGSVKGSVVHPELCPNITDVMPAKLLPNVDHPIYLFYQTIIGGVRLRQQQVVSKECSSGDTKHTTECYENNDNWLKPELHNFFVTTDTVNLPGAETHYLRSRTPRSDVRAELRKLEDTAWFNERSTMVEILFTTHNHHIDVFVATFIRFYINPSGHIHKVLEPVCHWLYPYHGWWCYLADGVWLALVIRLLLDDVVSIYRYWKELGFIKGTCAYMTPGNVICWLTVLYNFAIIACWLLYLNDTKELREHVIEADLTIPGSFASQQKLEYYYELVEVMSVRLFWQKGLMAGYPFIVGLRLFRTFDAQPRLALVTRTLQSAGMEIIHFGVVFFSAFMIYTASAMVLFGAELEEYSSIARAATSVFIVLLGGFDWDALSGVDLPLAMVWFWTYCILVQLIMLNMLLAIVMDVYTEVKSGLPENAPTIFSQTKLIYRRWHEKKLGLRISLDTILEAIMPGAIASKLSKTTTDDVMTPAQVMALVPGLSDSQACRILISANDAWIAAGKDPTCITDTGVRVYALTQAVATLQDTLEHQFNLQRMSACLTASTTRDILKHIIAVEDKVSPP